MPNYRMITKLVTELKGQNSRSVLTTKKVELIFLINRIFSLLKLDLMDIRWFTCGIDWLVESVVLQTLPRLERSHVL